MNEHVQNRLLAVQILSILGALAGEVFGVSLLTTVGVASFFGAVAALLAVMTIRLIEGVRRPTGPDMHEPSIDARAR